MRRFLTSSLLFFLPLLVLPFGTSYFETPKVIVAEISIAAMGLSLCLSNPRWKPLIMENWPIVALFLLSLIHLSYSSDPLFFGNQFRFQGTFLFWHLLLWMIVVQKDTKTHKTTDWKWAMILLIGISCSLWYYGTNAGGLLVGSMGEPNATAAVVVFTVPFFLFAPHRQWSRIVGTVGFILACLLVVVLQSRAGMIAIALMWLFSWLWSKSYLTKNSIVGVCLSIVLLSLTLPFMDTHRVLENRAEIWQTAWAAGWQHPVLGAGVGSVEYALKRAAQERSSSLRFQYVDSSHNLFLDWWIQGGIIGVSLLIFLIYYAAKVFITHDEPLFLCALGGVLVMMLFNPVSVASLVHFWWIVGVGNGEQK